MIARPDVEGFLLAGGGSRRMGAPKSGLFFDGEPIAARIARTLARHVARLTVVTDRPEEVAFLGLPSVSDIYAGKGPMGGLHAALTVSATPTVYLTAIDLPFLSEALIQELLRRHGSAPTTVPRTGDGLHPLCAVFDRSILAEVEQRLLAGQLSMRELVEDVGVDIVDISRCEPPIDPAVLTNINTPEDLRAARARISR